MPQPTDLASLQTHYRDRQTELNAQQRLAVSTRRWLRIAFVVCLVLAWFLAKHAIYGTATWWPILIPTAIILGLLPVYLPLQDRLTRIQRLLLFYDRNLTRLDLSEPQPAAATGEEFRSPTHLYDRDLSILGPNSLFGLLSTVRTGVGQRGLARLLVDAASRVESLDRQQAVQELAPQTLLREEIALLGASRFEQVSAAKLDKWLDEPPPTFHPAVRIVLALTSTALIAIILIGFFHYATWSTLFPNLALVLVLHTAVAAMVRSRVLPILEASKIANQTQMISDGLALLQRQPFTSSRLLALQKCSREPLDAVAAISRVQSQFVIVEQRSKEWFYVLSLLFAAGTHAAIAIANWKRANASAMKLWLAAWAEFEALNALANYAFEHPENIYPEILPDEAPATFEASALRHPLLSNCVPNNVALNAGTRFYLISGSNMAGKSTLLRSIGINAVLAYAGAPVRATSLRLTPLVLGASIALADSLAEGRSKFLAEVERLSAILKASSTAPVIFLVDEIFSGTNSEDRGAATHTILNKLLANGAIGALSTHDLTLTALATQDNGGLNVHMASPDPEDPLAFDYLLKPGINTASSARAILRLIGIDD